MSGICACHTGGAAIHWSAAQSYCRARFSQACSLWCHLWRSRYGDPWRAAPGPWGLVLPRMFARGCRLAALRVVEGACTRDLEVAAAVRPVEGTPAAGWVGWANRGVGMDRMR